jgi:membrane-associated protein
VGRVLFLGGVSAAVWNALLLAVGALLVRNLDEMVGFLEAYTRVAWALVAVVVAAVVAHFAWKWRRRGG